MGSNSDSDSNNDGHDGTLEPRDKRIRAAQRRYREEREEADIIDRFFLIARSQLHEVADLLENGNPRNPSEYRLGTKEKEEIVRITGMGLVEGVAAGVATFVLLRRGPVMIGRYVARRRQGRMSTHGSMNTRSNAQHHSQQQGKPDLGGTSYKLSDPNAGPHTSTAFDPYKVNPHWPRPRSFLLRAVWFWFDATISLMTAASVSMRLSGAERIKTQVSDLPLVEGHSLVATTLCKPVTQELQSVHRQQSSAYHRLRKRMEDGEDTPAALYFSGIIAFVENCERRTAMEERLRFSKGLAEDAEVEIPPPGVPRDEPRTHRWDQEMGDTGMDATQAGDDWVDRLTQDHAWDQDFK